MTIASAMCGCGLVPWFVTNDGQWRREHTVELDVIFFSACQQVAVVVAMFYADWGGRCRLRQVRRQVRGLPGKAAGCGLRSASSCSLSASCRGSSPYQVRPTLQHCASVYAVRGAYQCRILQVSRNLPFGLPSGYAPLGSGFTSRERDYFSFLYTLSARYLDGHKH